MCASARPLTAVAVPTVIDLAVVREDAIWKMKTASGSPCPSNVKVPVTAIGPVDL